MELSLQDLVVAVTSAVFTLATTWFGSFLSTKNERKKQEEQDQLFTKSIETEMADIVFIAAEIQGVVSKTLEDSIATKKAQWLYAPPVATPAYTEFYKAIQLKMPDTKRRNIRNFYSIVSEINLSTERCRGYLQSLSQEDRALLDMNSLRNWCIQLRALHRNIDSPVRLEDEEFLCEKEHSEEQFQRVLEMRLSRTN